MSFEFHLRVAGALQIGLAMLHLFFPTRFQWKEELARLSLLNRQMFLVHTFFVCVILLMIGALSLFAPQTVLEPTPLSRLVLGGFAAFWGLRLIFQWFIYDSRLWRGDLFKTFVHGLLTVIWTYLASVYAAVLLFQH
jgi:hypothetical protein